jgi:hypothetical protein
MKRQRYLRLLFVPKTSNLSGILHVYKPWKLQPFEAALFTVFLRSFSIGDNQSIFAKFNRKRRKALIDFKNTASHTKVL